MSCGFCVRVLVSLLTFGQHADGLADRRGGSGGVRLLDDYTKNLELMFAADFENSAEAGGILGSSSFSHRAGGQVDRYSPEGSVSSYKSGSLNIRNPNQNSQQRRTNSHADDVIYIKAGLSDLVSPQNRKRFESGVASREGIVMEVPPFKQRPSGFRPQQTDYSAPTIYRPQQTRGPTPPIYRPQQTGYPSPSGYQPQQTGGPTPPIYRPLQTRGPSPYQQIVYPSPSSFRPQQTDYSAPPIYQPLQTGGPTPPIYRPKPQQTGYPSPSGYRPQQTGGPSPSGYRPLQTGGPTPPIYRPLQTGGPSPSRYQPLQTGGPTPPIYRPLQTGGPSPSGYQPLQTGGPTPPIYRPQQTAYPFPSGYKPQMQKPTQNSPRPSQTDPDANGVTLTSGMLAFVSPQNRKIFDSGIISSKGIAMHAGRRPPLEPQPSVYEQVGIQMKPAIWEYSSPGGVVSGPNVQAGSSYRQQHVGMQREPSVRELLSPIGGVSGPDVQAGSSYRQRHLESRIKPARWGVSSPVRGVSGPDVEPANVNGLLIVPRTRQIPMSFPLRPRWQRSLVPV